MLRSLFTAISALHLHQTYLDVVADNLANVNTPGFKASNVMFQDLYAQLVNIGSAPTATTGGVNPTQIGLGLKLGNITPAFTQGTLNATGKNTDLAIQGDGMFIFSDSNGGRTYSREGSVQIDSKGYLVNASTGKKLQGWNANAQGVIDPNWPLQDLQVPLNTSIAKATTAISLAGNLSSATPTTGVNNNYSVTTGYFDSLGVENTTTLNFARQTGDAVNPPTTESYVDASTGATVNVTVSTWQMTITSPATGTLTPATVYVGFDQNGQVVRIGSTLGGAPADYVKSAGFNPANLPTVTVPGSNGAADTTFSVDPRNVSMLNMTNTISMDKRDGSSPGSVTDISVSADTGNVYLLYSNGVTALLGQISLAKFTNPSGLIRRGSSEFVEGVNSGPAQIGAPKTAGRGSISPGYLESSNVDLGQEFTNMILAQRGFEASSSVIRTGDQILQELVNLKR